MQDEPTAHFKHLATAHTPSRDHIQNADRDELENLCIYLGLAPTKDDTDTDLRSWLLQHHHKPT